MTSDKSKAAILASLMGHTKTTSDDLKLLNIESDLYDLTTGTINQKRMQPLIC